jgi:hypothetical protein
LWTFNACLGGGLRAGVMADRQAAMTAVCELSDGELSNLWRTEQVLHAVARVMLQGKLGEDVLGFPRLAVCECAEGVQALAGRVQREKLHTCCGSCTCAPVEQVGST